MIKKFSSRKTTNHISACLECEEGWEPYTNKCYKKYSPETDISWVNANFNCNNERVKSNIII